MKHLMLLRFFITVIVLSHQLITIEGRRAGPAKRFTATAPPSVEEASDEADTSSPEVDDDGRVYKNPRNSPSALCPRDEEQATLLGQKCLRKCSSDEDCKSKKKKCLCDGACGMSCIKPERECEELKEPELGGVSTTGRLFGDRASYTCSAGYHVVGLQERTCQADGSWSGHAPVCRKNSPVAVYCTSPPHIDNARHNALPEQTTFDLDSTLHYQCYLGYVTSGFPKAKCLAIDGAASWFGPDITCEPRSCGLPDDIPNGWHAGECHTYGCRVTYHCADGFELAGRGERFCQADGTWSPKELPACVLVTAVQCPPPDNPGNGKAIFTSCSFNSVVSYECKYGYTLVGEPTRRCGADRRWTGSQPKCQEINCGHPGPLYNGWIENIESGTGLGASIIFRCHEGMTLEGNTSSVCQIDGRWRYPLPKCLAPCVVPGVKQGSVHLLTTSAAGDKEPAREPIKELPMVVPHGEKLAVECEPRYEFPGNSTPVVCNNGTWTHIPRCEPARCKRMPRAPRNGMVIAPKTEHGMRARFKCKDGYSLRGPSVTECSYGNWTADVPYCQEVYCPFPGYIENGRVMLVGNMGVYDYRPYVRKVTNNKQIMYECERGYVLADGPPGATCLGGRWSPKQLPRCVPGMHPRLRWSRSVRAARAARSLREALLAAARRSSLLATSATSAATAAKQQRSQDAAAIGNDLPGDGARHAGAGAAGAAGAAAGSALVRRKRGGMRVSSGASTSSRTHMMRGNSNKNDGGGSRGSRGRKPKKPTDERIRPGHRPRPKGGKGAPCELLADEPTMRVEVVKAGRDPNQTYSPGTVVRVTCSKGYSLGLGRHSNNTAKCARGVWKPAKPECLIQNDDYPEGMVRTNGTCLYRNSEPNLVSFYNDQQITEEVVEFPPGSLVVSRCVDIGKYAMIGSNRRRCVAGEWDGQKPVCFGLNQENDYALEKPPTILFRHQLGPIAQSNDGRLVVYPGTILHMECLWIRRFGTPKWVVSHNYRKYPEGWTTDPGRDSQLEYRLSIYHAGRDDSGTFTCVTPTRHTHAVEIIVKAVHCPNIPPRRGLNLSTMNTKMNTKVTLSCANGNSLIGASEITCLPSGNWSAPIPICESIECADLMNLTDPHLRVSILSREVGGRAVFSCAQGYGLRGPHEAICLHTGDWASPLPSCEEVQCNSPGVPENGYIQGNGPYKAGDVIQFNCNPDYMMEGQPIIACQENGRWSGTIPKCVQACSYPGTTISGRMSAVKFYYKIGETITFTCDEGLDLRGAPMLRCLRNGKWSNAIPTCVSSNR